MRQKRNIIHIIQHVTLGTALGLGLVCALLASAAESGFALPPVKTVVLDPGHGGNDTGVKGPGGTLEKAVTLRLARLLENRLKDRYRVVLTRTDDYILDRADRTGHANHVRADVLVSLHAAGSYTLATRGLPIYHYTAPAIKLPVQPPDAGTSEIPWREIQKPHILASTILAQRIAGRTRPLVKPHPTTVRAAPLAVLAGADMPAILIEAGYLTSPKQEKNLNDNKYLFKLATAIGQGIDDFFNKPDTISSTDLRE